MCRYYECFIAKREVAPLGKIYPKMYTRRTGLEGRHYLVVFYVHVSELSGRQALFRYYVRGKYDTTTSENI